MRNLDIRLLVSEAGLKYIDIARQMKVSRQYLSLLMRYDLSPNNRQRILESIRELKGEKIGEE